MALGQGVIPGHLIPYFGLGSRVEEYARLLYDEPYEEAPAQLREIYVFVVDTIAKGHVNDPIQFAKVAQVKIAEAEDA
jgi:hypothetical protein